MTETELLAHVGERVHGREWRTLIAPHLHVSKSHVFALAAGTRGWTAPMRERLLAYAREHKVLVKAEAIRAEVALDELRDELERRWK